MFLPNDKWSPWYESQFFNAILVDDAQGIVANARRQCPAGMPSVASAGDTVNCQSVDNDDIIIVGYRYNCIDNAQPPHPFANNGNSKRGEKRRGWLIMAMVGIGIRSHG